MPCLRWWGAAETAFGLIQCFGSQEFRRLARSRGHGLLWVATRDRGLRAWQLLRQGRVICFTKFQAELRAGSVSAKSETCKAAGIYEVPRCLFLCKSAQLLMTRNLLIPRERRRFP